MMMKTTAIATTTMAVQLLSLDGIDDDDDDYDDTNGNGDDDDDSPVTDIQ